MNPTLIPREQTYTLNRKLVNISSVDRDVEIWPKSNCFEITLPQTLTNVQSIFISSSEFPIVSYTFEDSYQNTKMKFQLADKIYDISINEGFYTGDQLATELKNKMINAISGVQGLTTTFDVKYNPVDCKLYFLNTSSSGSPSEFEFLFDIENTHQFTCESGGTNQYHAWSDTSHWGLGFNLGFEKKRYISTLDNSFQFTHTTLSAKKAHVISADYPVIFFKDKSIYMEIDKYNTIDELSITNSNTHNLYNNNHNGRVNSFFAKLPAQKKPYNEVTSNKNDNLDSISVYSPPIEKISKLKFKFRFHDGTLVDFKNHEFSFILGFNCIQNEIPRNYNIRLPATFSV